MRIFSSRSYEKRLKLMKNDFRHLSLTSERHLPAVCDTLSVSAVALLADLATNIVDGHLSRRLRRCSRHCHHRYYRLRTRQAGIFVLRDVSPPLTLSTRRLQ